MASIPTGPAARGLQVFAIPGVCLLICFLAYYSQYLFNTAVDLLPGPLSRNETIVFNLLLACLWWTYYKACTVDPGRYSFDASTKPSPAPPIDPMTGAPSLRWCKKCRAPKPPRAHHCRHCGRCIPRMDHHCPWTGNCVSLQVFPYFLRFLVFTNISLWTLAYFLFQRVSAIWAQRHLPAYLGPTLTEMAGLTMLTLICTATMLALAILLFTTAKSWVLNMTMIESWESERHEAVLARYESEDANFWGLDGAEVILERIEFPYDLGLFDNMAQAMGTKNVLAWFFPFAGGPSLDKSGKGIGWEWEENGFNNRNGMWPPLDPEKLRRFKNGWPGAASRLAEQPQYNDDGEDVKAAFARRQEADLRRRAQRTSLMAELEELDDLDDVERHHGRDYYEEGMDGEPGWTNSEGDRLRDYGVDEEVEDEELIPLDADDDVPLSELIRRRKDHSSELQD